MPRPDGTPVPTPPEVVRDAILASICPQDVEHLKARVLREVLLLRDLARQQNDVEQKPQVPPPEPSSNSLHLVGDYWDIHFGDEPGHYPADRWSGLNDLAKLLEKPGRTLGLGEFLTVESARSLESFLGRDATLDDQAVTECWAEYDKYQDDLIRYKDNPSMLQKIRKLRDQLRKDGIELEDRNRRGSRSRKLGSDLVERAWGAVTKRIRDLYPRLEEKGMPNLAKHLRAYICMNIPTLKYDPPADTRPWDIQR
jgi:hypothetical protein